MNRFKHVYEDRKQKLKSDYVSCCSSSFWAVKEQILSTSQCESQCQLGKLADVTDHNGRAELSQLFHQFSISSQLAGWRTDS